MSVLVAGTVALDSIHTSHAIHNDLLGGSASYASLAATLSAPVHLCGIVGKDFPTEHRALFFEKKIDTANLDEVDGSTFRWTGRYHDDMNHRETLDVSIAVLENFNPHLTPVAAASKIVLLANMSPDNQLAVLRQCTNNPYVILDTMDLWINIARDGLLEVMKQADLFVINEDEAKLFTESGNLVQAGQQLLKMGPRSVIVKKGEHGAMLFGSNGQFFTAPAYPLEAVADPTGAGDTFAGGLAGDLAAGGDLSFASVSNATVWGGVLASFTCEEFGVKKLAGLNRATLDERMAHFREMTHW